MNSTPILFLLLNQNFGLKFGTHTLQYLVLNTKETKCLFCTGDTAQTAIHNSQKAVEIPVFRMFAVRDVVCYFPCAYWETPNESREQIIYHDSLRVSQNKTDKLAGCKNSSTTHDD